MEVAGDKALSGLTRDLQRRYVRANGGWRQGPAEGATARASWETAPPHHLLF